MNWFLDNTAFPVFCHVCITDSKYKFCICAWVSSILMTPVFFISWNIEINISSVAVIFAVSRCQRFWSEKILILVKRNALYDTQITFSFNFLSQFLSFTFFMIYLCLQIDLSFWTNTEWIFLYGYSILTARKSGIWCCVTNTMTGACVHNFNFCLFPTFYMQFIYRNDNKTVCFNSYLETEPF